MIGNIRRKPAQVLALAAARSIGCGWLVIYYRGTISTALGLVVIHLFAGTSRRYVYCSAVAAGVSAGGRYWLTELPLLPVSGGPAAHGRATDRACTRNQVSRGDAVGLFSSLYVLCIGELLAPAIGAFNSASQTAARAWASTPKGKPIGAAV
jgi:hypothetical protein